MNGMKAACGAILAAALLVGMAHSLECYSCGRATDLLCSSTVTCKPTERQCQNIIRGVFDRRPGPGDRYAIKKWPVYYTSKCSSSCTPSASTTLIVSCCSSHRCNKLVRRTPPAE
ncbi:weak neurotoxin 10-like [Ambystoma mexicanum]|uniref:weak neurotoxin 10-like n=1 Tax=Ambystoma mexicanum TaxID=8296 RepID=UPI0037E74A55